MIGKHIPSPKGHSSFKGLNDYITGKTNRQPGEKIALTGCLNLASVETATIEMESLAFQNKRSKDPVMHLLLSWRENENPTQEQVNKAATITLDELNISQCQALYALHRNTDNLNLHICVNR
ncbi:MAG: relaxase/mobilization nuclease domain-containing protein, partial [Synergistaceae bacterium]|nr:relaxase/mobilization nuclease domain-containing protein [Synergistaceae bacterium]